MTGLTKRLRERAGEYDEYAWHREIELEAADEIDKLQSAIHDMAKNIWRGDWNRLEQETRDVVERVMKEKGER
jgi:hypothetical protein